MSDDEYTEMREYEEARYQRTLRWHEQLPAIIGDEALTLTVRRWLPSQDDLHRALFGIPPGFPLWFEPERPALPVGPIGRAQTKIREILDDPIVRQLIGGSIQ
ncbi:hypothetical protein [Nocardia wallacei]|uniref:hypothetical protein n=1 Tax=Nocardia wallacei TaxID=480035 RepID=UPI002455B51C|nr:hypothetical protein [Nocardia wallacei]